MSQKTFRPTLPAERIEAIDILRGFALFGILIINVFGYQASFYDFGGFYRGLTDPLQKSFYQWVIGFGADKFIFMFSMLFGLGFWILYEKYFNREKHFVGFYIRRMLALMLFGILHVVLLWAGDILLIYGVLGLILLAVRRFPQRLLWVLMFVFYYFTILFMIVRIYVPSLPDPLTSTSTIPLADVVNVYSHAGWFDTLIFRLNEYFTFRNINLLYYAPKVMGLFIAGYLAGRHNLVQKLRRNNFRYWLVALLFFSIGLFFTLQLDHLAPLLVNPESVWFGAFYMGAYETGNIFLGLSYLLLVYLAATTATGEMVLRPLKYPGRMSLTNYLMQSLVFTTIFYGYGFGKFGTTAPTTFVGWAVILFILQVIGSRLWLYYFRYGPVELLWRKMSYLNWRRAG